MSPTPQPVPQDIPSTPDDTQRSQAEALLKFPTFVERLRDRLQRQRRDNLVQEYRLASVPERSLEQLIADLIANGRIDFDKALALLSITNDTLVSYMLEQHDCAARQEADSRVALA